MRRETAVSVNFSLTVRHFGNRVSKHTSDSEQTANDDPAVALSAHFGIMQTRQRDPRQLARSPDGDDDTPGAAQEH